jgi:hypothetical protein
MVGSGPAGRPARPGRVPVQNRAPTANNGDPCPRRERTWGAKDSDTASNTGRDTAGRTSRHHRQRAGPRARFGRPEATACSGPCGLRSVRCEHRRGWNGSPRNSVRVHVDRMTTFAAGRQDTQACAHPRRHGSTSVNRPHCRPPPSRSGCTASRRAGLPARSNADGIHRPRDGDTTSNTGRDTAGQTPCPPLPATGRRDPRQEPPPTASRRYNERYAVRDHDQDRGRAGPTPAASPALGEQAHRTRPGAWFGSPPWPADGTERPGRPRSVAARNY